MYPDLVPVYLIFYVKDKAAIALPGKILLHNATQKYRQHLIDLFWHFVSKQVFSELKAQ